MTRRSWLILLLAFGLSVGLAYALRFGLVENQDVVAACAENPAQLRCVVLETAIFTFHHLLLGGLALAGALLALALPRLWTFLSALVPAAFALVLYNVEMGATAVMLCLLATARVAPRKAPA
ncbi:MAG TPA: hypothetical protein VJL84_11090 [Kiloniellales bacterium]|nr:hypothetical protein [Kiloniellales bacterium]